VWYNVTKDSHESTARQVWRRQNLKMINRVRARIGWIRSQSVDSLIIIAVMIVMATIMMPLMAGIVFWIYTSRLSKTIGKKLSAKPKKMKFKI
jgi:hypothetical protein